MMNKYRIKEVKYSNGTIRFSPQYCKTTLFGQNKWVDIDKYVDCDNINLAKKSIEDYDAYLNPPKIIYEKIHDVEIDEELK